MGGGRHRARVQHGHARRHRRQRGPAHDRQGPAHLAGRPAVDGDRLHAHAGRADPARRRAGRPVRPAPGVPHRRRSGSPSPPRCAGSPRTSACSSPRGRCRASAGRCSPPGSLAIIQSTFAAEDRPRAIGAWSGPGRGCRRDRPVPRRLARGSSAGGWIFLINLPLAAAVVLVSLRHVPESRDPTARGRFDIAGAVLAALALAGLTYALIEARPAHGCLAAVVPAPGRGRGRGFRPAGAYRGRHPARGAARCCRSAIFSSRQFTAINVITFIVYGAMGGGVLPARADLQVVAGFSPLEAGSRCCRPPPLHAAAVGPGRRAGPADRPALADDRRPARRRAGLLLLDPHRAGRLLRGRCAARRRAVRAGPVDDRGAAHRHRAGQRR